MKNYFTLFKNSTFFIVLLFVLGFTNAEAQTANNQVVVTQCYTGPTASFTNTTGTAVGGVVFQTGTGANQIPAGYRIADVIVEIVWSKSDLNSCTTPTGVASDLSHIGFKLRKQGMNGTYLAPSAATAGNVFPNPTTASFTGLFSGATVGVLSDTITFRNGYPSLLPSGIPNTARDTFSPNGRPLSHYYGLDPTSGSGAWFIDAIDDAPSAGPALCIHSYCITIVACHPSRLVAVCKANPTVNLDASGNVTFSIIDLDSASDVSCLIKAVNISPATANCSNIGTPLAVTMTFHDHLDSVAVCSSLVNVVDVTPPSIDCHSTVPTAFIGYLNSTGSYSFSAASLDIRDSCSNPVVKEVRPRGNPTWTPDVTFNCVTRYRQFWVRGTDASGNVDSCLALINLIDTIPPTAVCGSYTAYLGANNNGLVTVNAIDVDGGSFDVCFPLIGRWIGTVNASPPRYTCADLGSHTVTLLVQDANNNVGSCSTAVINVVDTIAPVAICQTATVYLDAGGNGRLLATQVNNNSTDNCTIDSININGFASIAYTCNDVNATQTVMLHVFDESRNTDSCMATITIIDTFPPTAICRNVVGYLDASAGGNVIIAATSLNNNSIDVCTGTNLSFQIAGNSSITFSCSNLGSNTVPLTVLDSFGNQSTCNASVSIQDTIAPTASCTVPTIYLDAAGNASVSASQLNNNSSDNCSIANLYINTVGLSSTTFNCSAINTPQSAILIVEDGSGNITRCTTMVNVVDTITPTALCHSIYTAQLNGVGLAVVTPIHLDSASNDNCAAGVSYLINGINSQTYTCTDIGTTNAVLTIRDSSNNIATCVTSIRVEDNIPPVAACQTQTIYLDAAGNASIAPNDILNTVTTADNCSNINAVFQGGLSNINYTCDSLGARAVQVIVSDASNNSATCATTVTILDTVPPTAICRSNFTVQLDSFGRGNIVPADINLGSSDLCGIDTMFINGVDSFFYTCTNTASTAAVLSVLDGSGTTSTCISSITVNDPIAPVALCHDTTLYLNATGVATVVASNIDAGSSDNCNLSLSINGAPSVNYNCSNIGTNTGFLTASDGSNTSGCSANITILDTITPTANCTAAGAITLYVPAGQCFASTPAAAFNNNSLDNCASSLTYSVGGFPNVTLTSLGINNIILTVTDGSGNTATCSTSAVLLDTISPTMICMTDTIQLNNNGSGILLPFNINGGSFDNCGTPVYSINGLASLPINCTHLGNNQITLVGSDASGNSSSCVANVLVQDLIAPQAQCRSSATVVLNGITGIGTLQINQIDAPSTDNCTITNLSLSQTTFNCADIGNNPHHITLTVTDQSGNTSQCSTLVTIVDTLKPTAICIGSITRTLAGTNVSISSTDIDNGSTDNCAIQSYTLNQNTFNCSNIGTNIVSMTVTDSSGNSNTCNTTVTILDNTPPVAACNNLTVQLDAAGIIRVAATDIAAGSFDNCSLSTILVNGLDSVTYNCTHLNTPQVANIYIQDPSGLTATCAASITIEDHLVPRASCIHSTISLALDVFGNANLNPTAVNNNSTDNCSTIGANNLGLSQTTFNCNHVSTSPNPITLTVTDASGNAATCVAQVNIIDTIRPTMRCRADTVYLNAGGVATILASDFDNGTTDACGLASLTFSGASNPVGCNFIGTHTITLIGTDVNNNIDSCLTTLTVLDTVPPSLICNNISLNLDANGQLVVDATTNSLYTTSDACSASNLLLNGTNSITYDCGDIGRNNITLVSTDAGGNTATCVAIIDIIDATAPVLTCSNSITQYLDANGQLTVDPSWILNTTIEACTIDTIFASPTTMNCNNIGSNNIVAITVIDSSGNQNTCSASLPIADTLPPTMVCRDTSICLSNGFVNVNAADIDGGTFDGCGLSPVMSINGNSNIIYTCRDIGTQVTILERRDIRGNRDTCHAIVTVLDCNPPTAVCQSYTAQLGANGTVTVHARQDIDLSSSDDCQLDSNSFAINGLDSLTYTCAFIGSPDTVLFTVADLSGNLDSCYAIITVEDHLAPIARCTGSPLVRALPPNGIVTVAAFNLNSIATPSSDNCGISSYLINGLAVDTFNCTHAGINQAILTVTDNHGNTDTCTAIIDIRDFSPPTINCTFSTNVVLDSVGQIRIAASSLATANDNCGIAAILANGHDTLTLGCNNLGPNPITVTAIDYSNDSSSCTAIVTVTDNTPPVAICAQNPVVAYLDGTSNGATYIHANQIDSASFDNCGITRYLINGQDSAFFSCSNIGTLQQATLTVFDATNASATCLATIQILDTVPPVALCNDTVTIQLSNFGIAIIPSSTIDSASFDNCNLNISSMLINGYPLDTFNCSNVNNPVRAELKVFDNSGNFSTCYSNIIVLDRTRPNINCPSSVVDVYLDNNGQAIVDPQSIATASDTCTILYWYINNQALDTFDCADANQIHLVDLRVEDPSGNSASCSALLQVLDTLAPTAHCQNLISIALDSNGTYRLAASDIDLFSSDNCGIRDYFINGIDTVHYLCDSVPPTTSPPTYLSAVLTVVDSSNNANSCNTQVILVDNINPVALCRDTVHIQLDNTPNGGTATIGAFTLDSFSTDACTPLSFTFANTNLASETFGCTHLGSNNPRALRITDANGNFSFCQSVVDVLDVHPPTAVCQNINAYLDNAGLVTINASQINNNSFDNCSMLPVSFSTGSAAIRYDCSDVGLDTVTLIITDRSGNLDSCQATVTITDTIPPVPSCQNATSLFIDLTQNGQTILNPNSISGGQSFIRDNCGIDTVWLSKDTVFCTDVGRIPITLYVRDVNGLTSSCTDTFTTTLVRPIITIPTQDTILCEGDTLPLSGTVPSAGISYTTSWSGPTGHLSNNTTIQVNGVQAADEGFYTFTIIPPVNPQGIQGCPASDTVTLDVNVVPPPVITSNPICEGDTAVLYLANHTSYSGTNFNYTWYFNGSPYSPNPNNDTLIILSATPSINGNYTMLINVDGCIDSSNIAYTAHTISLPSAPAPYANEPCEGELLNLFANPTDSTRMPYTYVWTSSSSNILNSTQADPSRASSILGYAGIYYLTITDSDGCSIDSFVNVNIRPKPVQPNIFYTQPFCVDDILELQDTTGYNIPPLNFMWQAPNGDTTTTNVPQLLVMNADSGVYSLTVISNGCISLVDTQTVRYEPVPDANDDTYSVKFRDSLIGANIIANDILYSNGFIINQISSNPNSTILFNANGTMNYQPNGGFFGNDTIYYSLCDAQCPTSCDTAMIIITVTTDFECFIPNGISPNGDGINDELTVRCRHNYPNAIIEIFSRWGTLVYKGDPMGWNGQFDGKDLPDGTYFYVLKLNDTTYVGTGRNNSRGRVGDQYTGFIILQR